MLTQKVRAEKQLLAVTKKAKRQPAREKAPRIKMKNCLLKTLGVDAEGRVVDAEGRDEVNDDDDE